MHVGPAENTNPAAWGLPAHGSRVHPDRVVVPKPVHDATTPTPRPFARVLRDINQTPYAMGTQARGLSHDAVIYRPGCAHKCGHAGAGTGSKLHPTLGEVLPVDADPKQTLRIVTTRQQLQPATGRALDLYL
jgi:hypothetical protein